MLVPMGGATKIFNKFLPQIYPLQDLLSAAKSAVVHGVNRRLDAGPNGVTPRRVAPGEVFSSPRSGASEVCGFHREHGRPSGLVTPSLKPNRQLTLRT